MKRIVLAVALLLGGTAVANAEQYGPSGPPGLTPAAPEAQPAPDGPGFGARDGRWMGERGQRMGERGQRMGERGQRMGQRGQRMGRHRLPPAVRARLVQMFDRDGDGRLQGPERRAARRFARQVLARRAQGPQQRGPR
jgi:hypothetical protein